MSGYGSIKTGRLVTLASGHYPQVTSGLDASKTASPGIGDVYFATDTEKQYICYLTTIWTLVDAPSVERYSNHLGTVDNIMSITLSGNATAVTTGHQMDLNSGTIDSYVYYTADMVVNTLTDYFIFRTKILTPVPSGGTIFWVGLRNSDTGDGVFFDINNSLVSIFFNGHTEYDQSITPIASGDILIIIGQKNKFIFIVNGLVVGTATNVLLNYTVKPTYYMYIGSPEGIAASCSCDYIDFEVLK